MGGKRFVFCIKGMNKSLLFTDKEDERSLSDIELGLTKIFSENKFLSFRTPTDLLIARSSDLSAISVQELGAPNTNGTNCTQTTNRLTDNWEAPNTDLSDQILDALETEEVSIEETENLYQHPEILTKDQIQKLLDSTEPLSEEDMEDMVRPTLEDLDDNT